MSSIDLKTFDQQFGSLNLSESKEKIQKAGFTYTDLKLDLSLNDIINNFPVDQELVTKDAEALIDDQAIRQAIANIFNTVQGQKLLNPYLGLDLKRFLFSPISETVASNIAQTILEGLVDQEPRIVVSNIAIEGVIDEAAYYISFTITFPNFKNKESVLLGKLNSRGFELTSENKHFENKTRQVRDRYWDFK